MRRGVRGGGAPEVAEWARGREIARRMGWVNGVNGAIRHRGGGRGVAGKGDGLVAWDGWVG